MPKQEIYKVTNEEIKSKRGYCLTHLSRLTDISIPALKKAIKSGDLPARDTGRKYIVLGRNAIKYLEG
jgi:hypothetical protein